LSVKQAIADIAWDRQRISMSGGLGDIIPYGNPELDNEESQIVADVVSKHEGVHLAPVLSDGRTASIRFVFKPKKDSTTFEFIHAATRLETIDPANPLTLEEKLRSFEGPESLEGLPLGDDDISNIRACKALLKKYAHDTPWREIRDEFEAIKANPEPKEKLLKPSKIDFEVLSQLLLKK